MSFPIVICLSATGTSILIFTTAYSNSDTHWNLLIQRKQIMASPVIYGIFRCKYNKELNQSCFLVPTYGCGRQVYGCNLSRAIVVFLFKPELVFNQYEKYEN